MTPSNSVAHVAPSKANRDLRQTLRQTRRNLSASIQRKNSQLVTKHLTNHLAFLNARHVGIYWPMDGEIDITGIQKMSSTQFYWPVLQETARRWQGKGLLFARSNGCWHTNRYGIPEPKHTTLFNARDLDCLLIPLVGFDSEGNRLGMGGGYYDRALARLTCWRATRLIGVAHDIQQVENLARNAWDIPMREIVTESGVQAPNTE